MFLPLDSTRPAIRVAGSQFSDNDWEVLSRFWYPVALAKEVTDRPVKARLLDVELVLYRSEQGITVALDRCPHRWVRLSAGSVCDGNIVCAFHGLTFDGTGQCVRVPALGRSVKMPPSYSVRTFRSKVRHGMVWVCLSETSESEVPEYECLAGHDETTLIFAPVWQWPMSAARQIENFFDLAHLPFIHATTLGGDPGARLRPPSIDAREDSLIFRTRYTETVGWDQPTEFDFTYRVYLPFAIDFQTTPVGGTGLRSMNIASPSSAHDCKVFQLVIPAPGEPKMDEAKMLAMGEAFGVINRQDIEIMGQLSIQDLPLNEKLEIHLPVDNVSMAYRRRLQELGLGRR